MFSRLRNKVLLASSVIASVALYTQTNESQTKSSSLLSTSKMFQNTNVLASVEDIPGLTELTPEERAKHTKQFMRCEQMKLHALGSRKVRFMFNALAELNNVVLEPEKFVQCVHCDIPLYAFAITHPEATALVGICQNHAHDQTALTDSLTHELVHVYDSVRAHLDHDNCIHVACTEVRAAMLSGECSKEKEISRGAIAPGFTEPDHFRKCVRRRANNSIKAQPNCSDPKVCAESLDLVFDRCFIDKSPFYAVPE